MSICICRVGSISTRLQEKEESQDEDHFSRSLLHVAWHIVMQMLWLKHFATRASRTHAYITILVPGNYQTKYQKISSNNIFFLSLAYHNVYVLFYHLYVTTLCLLTTTEIANLSHPTPAIIERNNNHERPRTSAIVSS